MIVVTDRSDRRHTAYSRRRPSLLGPAPSGSQRVVKHIELPRAIDAIARATLDPCPEEHRYSEYAAKERTSENRC